MEWLGEMGLPQELDALETEEPIVEAQVEVSFHDWYGADAEETSPWCVDHGSSMEVLRTRDIYTRVEAGKLNLDTKVWRDGRACWLAIAECYELTIAPAEPAGEVPEQSGLRRVPTAPIPLAEPTKPHRPPSAPVLLGSALLCGVFLGLLVNVPYEPQPRHLSSQLTQVRLR
jgi:hypothetical protein